ncbi:MAG TPA: hypothetical protein DIU15_11730 [Deltaproteobacteria bacterium]|nr:hypothetical protein [Deltaproteobacteria bacterium]HCP46708.1 hypothetical protein [Deltaproteobacteria bacterium]|tara:strand:- start:89 stop:730 length:642 start_codon:yes stop_codon:yes gene_type:complete
MPLTATPVRRLVSYGTRTTRHLGGTIHHVVTALLMAFALVLGVGCAGSSADDGTPSCTPDPDLAEGEMRATVDGEEWLASDGVYSLQPVGLLVNVVVDPANSMNMLLSQVAEYTVDEEGDLDVELGAEVGDVLSDENLPLDFKLGRTSSDGGSVTLYVDDVTHQSNETLDDGFARITGVGDVITGCFFFSAGVAQGSGDDVQVEDGSFSVRAM